MTSTAEFSDRKSPTRFTGSGTSDPTRYFLRPDYRVAFPDVPRPALDTPYWSEGRIEMSAYYQASVYRRAADFAREDGIRDLLDIGCGPGVKLMGILDPLVGNAVGIDDRHAVEVCSRLHPNGTFYADDFDSPKLDLGRAFDLIICADVIEHVIDPDMLLDYIRRHATEATQIFISTPERNRLRGQHCVQSPKSEHIREWNKEEFRGYLEHRGFRVMEHSIRPKMRFHFREWRKMMMRPLSFYSALMCCQMARCRIS